jgi:hypothetical protein
MTEGEKTGCKLGIRRELQLARLARTVAERDLHLRWVAYFVDRLDGKPKAQAHRPQDLEICMISDVQEEVQMKIAA